MNAALSEAIKEAYTLAPPTPILETIELYHPGIASRIYLVKDYQNRELGLETGENAVFKACGFKVTLPGTDAEMNLTICNVDRQVAEFAELATSMMYPVEVTFRPYLLSDLTYPQMDPPLTMFLNDVSIDVMNVTGRATFANILNRKWPAPSEYYNTDRFPGL